MQRDQFEVNRLFQDSSLLSYLTIVIGSLQARSILERLQGLPLAITQAGAYLRETNMALSDFIKHYDSTWDLLMQEQDKFPLEEYSERTIWTTWRMSYEQIRHQSQEAAGLLKLWAFLDRGDLWYELVASALELHSELDIDVPAWLLKVVTNQLAFSSALRTLTRYSLIDTREETSSHSMHAVLHQWCYSLSVGKDQMELSAIAIGIVVLAIPSESDHKYRVLQRRLLPHATQVYRWILCARRVLSEWMNDSHEGWLFHTFGLFFADQGKLAEAEKMYQQALEGKEKTLGPEHTSTLNTFNNLGNLYADQGKLAKAEKIYQRVLKGYEKALGPEHISTLRTINNLGLLYADQGKLAEAEKMYQRALEGYEKTLGPEHTSTLNTVNNLGILYADQGKLAKAEKMYQRVLKGYEKAFGPEHISTLRIVNNLGILYADQGKLAKAEKMYQRALKGYEKAFGPEDETIPKLNTVNNLGNLYKDQGKLAEAEEMLQRALKGKENILGSEHTSTLDTINNLGLLYANQGKLAEAEKMYQRALKGYEKALGPEDKTIPKINTVNNLGTLYKDQGKLAEAEEMFQRALEGYEKALGPEHSKCETVKRNITNLHGLKGINSFDLFSFALYYL